MNLDNGNVSPADHPANGVSGTTNLSSMDQDESTPLNMLEMLLKVPFDKEIYEELRTSSLLNGNPPVKPTYQAAVDFYLNKYCCDPLSCGTEWYRTQRRGACLDLSYCNLTVDDILLLHYALLLCPHIAAGITHIDISGNRLQRVECTLLAGLVLRAIVTAGASLRAVTTLSFSSPLSSSSESGLNENVNSCEEKLRHSSDAINGDIASEEEYSSVTRVDDPSACTDAVGRVEACRFVALAALDPKREVCKKSACFCRNHTITPVQATQIRHGLLETLALDSIVMDNNVCAGAGLAAIVTALTDSSPEEALVGAAAAARLQPRGAGKLRIFTVRVNHVQDTVRSEVREAFNNNKNSESTKKSAVIRDSADELKHRLGDLFKEYKKLPFANEELLSFAYAASGWKDNGHLDTSEKHLTYADWCSIAFKRDSLATDLSIAADSSFLPTTNLHLLTLNSSFLNSNFLSKPVSTGTFSAYYNGMLPSLLGTLSPAARFALGGIRTIQLSENHIGNRGVPSLCLLLRSLPVLERLFLVTNLFGGVPALTTTTTTTTTPHTATGAFSSWGGSKSVNGNIAENGWFPASAVHNNTCADSASTETLCGALVSRASTAWEIYFALCGRPFLAKCLNARCNTVPVVSRLRDTTRSAEGGKDEVHPAGESAPVYKLSKLNFCSLLRFLSQSFCGIFNFFFKIKHKVSISILAALVRAAQSRGCAFERILAPPGSLPYCYLQHAFQALHALHLAAVSPMLLCASPDSQEDGESDEEEASGGEAWEKKYASILKIYALKSISGIAQKEGKVFASAGVVDVTLDNHHFKDQNDLFLLSHLCASALFSAVDIRRGVPFSNLTHLCLDYNALGDVGAVALAALLNEPTTACELWHNACGSCNETTILSSRYRTLSDIGDVKFRKTGRELPAPLLPVAPKNALPALVVLGVSDNGIGDNGAVALFLAIGSNPNSLVARIDLSVNNLSDNAFIVCANVLSIRTRAGDEAETCGGGGLKGGVSFTVPPPPLLPRHDISFFVRSCDGIAFEGAQPLKQVYFDWLRGCCVTAGQMDTNEISLPTPPKKNHHHLPPTLWDSSSLSCLSTHLRAVDLGCNPGVHAAALQYFVTEARFFKYTTLIDLTALGLIDADLDALTDALRQGTEMCLGAPNHNHGTATRTAEVGAGDGSENLTRGSVRRDGGAALWANTTSVSRVEWFNNPGVVDVACEQALWEQLQACAALESARKKAETEYLFSIVNEMTGEKENKGGVVGRDLEEKRISESTVKGRGVGECGSVTGNKNNENDNKNNLRMPERLMISLLDETLLNAVVDDVFETYKASLLKEAGKRVGMLAAVVSTGATAILVVNLLRKGQRSSSV